MVAKEKSYQELADQLNLLMDKLQAEDCSIEDALELYEHGVALTDQLRDYLAKAENKLKKIAIAQGKS